MTNEEFQRMFDELQAYYCGMSGRTVQLNARAVKGYYDACRCVQDGQADSFYYELIGNCKYFPRLPEFREVAEKYRGRRERLSNAEYCWYCTDHGVIEYDRMGDGLFPHMRYTHLARCVCNAGRNYMDFPLISQLFTQDELDWLAGENRRTYSGITPEQMQQTKEQVQRLLKKPTLPSE